MASSIAKNQEIQRLVSLSEESRLALGQEILAVRQRLDVKSRLRHSIMQKPSQWLFGGLASGIVASLLFRRRAPRVKSAAKRSLPLALVGIALAALRPFVQSWAIKYTKDYLAGKSFSFSTQAARPARPQPPASV